MAPVRRRHGCVEQGDNWAPAGAAVTHWKWWACSSRDSGPPAENATAAIFRHAGKTTRCGSRTTASRRSASRLSTAGLVAEETALLHKHRRRLHRSRPQRLSLRCPNRRPQVAVETQPSQHRSVAAVNLVHRGDHLAYRGRETDSGLFVSSDADLQPGERQSMVGYHRRDRDVGRVGSERKAEAVAAAPSVRFGADP